eukprot:symbB.v1.2.032711.t2/scaffold3962.1/size79057/5
MLALIVKAIKCFETVLKNLPASDQVARRPGTMSRAAYIVESVLRLKVMGFGDSEYSVLVDAVEELLLHASSVAERTSLQPGISQCSEMAPVSRLAIALNLEPPNAVLLKRYRHLLQESSLPEPDLRTQHWRPEIEVPFRGPETEESTSDGSPVSSNGSTHATDSMDGNQSS